LKVAYFAVVALIAVVAIAWVYTSQQTKSGMLVEVGIIRSDGTIVPLNIRGDAPLATFTVNGVPVTETDWIYMKAWLNLKATGTSGTVTSIRFKYWQKWMGVPESEVFGTEEGYKVYTSPTESWFLVSLPQDIDVKVPLKYRDFLVEGEPATPIPFSVYDPTNNQMIREARLFKMGSLNMPTEGTYTMEMMCTVYEVKWQYDSHSEDVTLSPNTYYVKFVITKTVSGSLSATISGQASH